MSTLINLIPGQLNYIKLAPVPRPILRTSAFGELQSKLVVIGPEDPLPDSPEGALVIRLSEEPA